MNMELNHLLLRARYLPVTAAAVAISGIERQHALAPEWRGQLLAALTTAAQGPIARELDPRAAVQLGTGYVADTAHAYVRTLHAAEAFNNWDMQ